MMARLSRRAVARRRDSCTGKPRNTEAEARALAEKFTAETGDQTDAYPCPYSRVGEALHWHTGRRGIRQVNVNWYLRIHADAIESGCVGWQLWYVPDDVAKAIEAAHGRE